MQVYIWKHALQTTLKMPSPDSCSCINAVLAATQVAVHVLIPVWVFVGVAIINTNVKKSSTLESEDA